jgi:prepilin-type N-terminal cleavage/methylation domain-containing protein
VEQAMKNQKGSTLIEVIVALALLGAIGVAFLSALATTSKSRTISTEHTAARIIAASQMDTILNEPYASSYSPVPAAPEYEGYTTSIDIVNFPDGNLQKITVMVKHRDKVVTKLESYKVIR